MQSSEPTTQCKQRKANRIWGETQEAMVLEQNASYDDRTKLVMYKNHFQK
ncbi:uncharacterized protein PHALS_04455 [Plasmopara halstedii]|uniref:Uncharacterized protein n=1 Tax=Plasmopara halstedii TaxID=4781 RepID=A0A0P1A9C9_PLAHL|nr:uncharacterized protein PHALS_04455 [Plasmopara halstedii]CEG36989.1 hypothetical protein PHALS_04455 [Plasmopara halstedii]|eukprot:XP_024573358.1 hypothetical protein PHALS_04455 [Plasmopara halstedii]